MGDGTEWVANRQADSLPARGCQSSDMPDCGATSGAFAIEEPVQDSQSGDSSPPLDTGVANMNIENSSRLSAEDGGGSQQAVVVDMHEGECCNQHEHSLGQLKPAVELSFTGWTSMKPKTEPHIR